MTNGQENMLNMYLTTDDYLGTHVETTNLLPNYPEFITLFKSSISSIKSYSGNQIFDKTGIAINKQQLRDDLIMRAVDASRKLTAYATYTKDQVLLKETSYTVSDLKRGSDTQLMDKAQGIYDRAQAHLPELEPYGITAKTQAELQTSLTGFISAIPKPRLGITEKKQNTAQLAVLFDTAYAALKNIETLIEIVRSSEPDFYTGFKSASKLVRTSRRSLAVKGLVTDALSGEPVKGASLQFVAVGNGAHAKDTVRLIKKTAKKGGFTIQSLPEGNYTVTISKIGYTTQTISLAIADGDLAELNVKLVKS